MDVLLYVVMGLSFLAALFFLSIAVAIWRKIGPEVMEHARQMEKQEQVRKEADRERKERYDISKPGGWGRWMASLRLGIRR